MELLTLTWQNVDLKWGRIILHHTKNRDRRTLPLTGLALAEMQRLSRIRRLDTPFVFGNTEGTGPTDIWRPWKRALREGGIEDFRFHDLRHSAASYLAMNGASLQEIGVILGHKTLSMARRYAHLGESHVTNVLERMTSAIFGGGA
jgi:integrase